MLAEIMSVSEEPQSPNGLAAFPFHVYSGSGSSSTSTPAPHSSQTNAMTFANSVNSVTAHTRGTRL